MDNNVTKGTKLLIALVGGQIYEGILSSVNCEYISLSNVSEYPAAAKNNDNTRLKFYKNEVSAVAVFQTIDKPLRADIPVVPLYYEQFEELKQKSREYVYISMVDERYHDAMKHLESCDVIAVFGLGCNSGRCDTAILISVATKKKVYIFDNLISNKRVIEMGLNDILASEKIKKIFHNCSGFSDCLQHVYKIELANVFDTEAADIMLRAEAGRLPSHARELSELVNVYLKLPTEKTDVSHYTRKELLKRPLADNIKLNIALQTMYLIYLKRVLESKMLAGFYADVDALLNTRYEANPESSCELSEQLKWLADT